MVNTILTNETASESTRYQHDPAEIPLNDNGDMNATAFFTKLKDTVSTYSDKELTEYLDVAAKLHEKYVLTGQTQAAAQIQEYIRVANDELALLNLGFETYVLRADVANWAKEHSKKVSKKILFADIEQYTRDIPNDVVMKMLKAKPYVDKFVILFTDYTGQHQKQVDATNAQIKKEHDPIVFGAWVPQDEEAKKTMIAHPHLIFIGDWEDQYCDLTLDKLIKEFAKNGDPEFKKTLSPTEILESAVRDNLPKTGFLAKIKGLLHIC